MDTQLSFARSARQRAVLVAVLVAIAIVSGVGILWLSFGTSPNLMLQLMTGSVFTLAVAGCIWALLDPDTRTARTSDDLLKLASQMLDCIKGGMTAESAQRVCELLLPTTSAIAVAITDKNVILGYAGYNAEGNPEGTNIRTTATHETLTDGKPRILLRTDDIGLPMASARISAAIIQPLYRGREIAGTLKFYYRRARDVTQTQQSVVHGYAELLSTQMAASALEEQTQLATSMELKALQAQINPHFLFNTINTIASLIRTDPTKARILLREFAVFYRSTLEDADDLIPLDRELAQVERYFTFEVARFGEDRLSLAYDIEDEVFDMLVPSFMIQPIVENAVRHALRTEGKLHVRVTGHIEGDNIVVNVIDDGAGMSEETLRTITTDLSDSAQTKSDEHLGIALKNVRDRIRSYYGPEARMEVESKLGEGTTVSFVLDREIATDDDAEIGYLEDTNQRGSVLPNIPDPVIN